MLILSRWFLRTFVHEKKKKVVVFCSGSRQNVKLGTGCQVVGVMRVQSCCFAIRDLKQRRFWATHVNRKWGFSLFICLDANKLLLLSFFSLLKTIYPRVSTKPLPNDAKSPLPVYVRRSKTLLLKLPNINQEPCISLLLFCLSRVPSPLQFSLS